VNSSSSSRKKTAVTRPPFKVRQCIP
jgi:hypothetical protein